VIDACATRSIGRDGTVTAQQSENLQSSGSTGVAAGDPAHRKDPR
jgi:hypothetical protein